MCIRTLHSLPDSLDFRAGSGFSVTLLLDLLSHCYWNIHRSILREPARVPTVIFAGRWVQLKLEDDKTFSTAYSLLFTDIVAVLRGFMLVALLRKHTFEQEETT